MSRRRDQSTLGTLTVNLTFTVWKWRTELALLLVLLATYTLLHRGLGTAGTMLWLLLTATLFIGPGQIRGHRFTGPRGWLLDRLHAARTRRHWSRAVHRGGATDPHPRRSHRPDPILGPRAKRVTRVAAGDLLDVRIGRGSSISRLEQCQGDIENEIRAPIEIRRDARNPARATVLIRRCDPFEEAASSPWPPLADGLEGLTVWEPVVIGADEDGAPVQHRIVGGHVLVGGITGGGKALALDTPIPTPNGWTTMGDLRAGDSVFDERGEPCLVTHAWPVRHDRPCYEVEFSDGSKIVADGEHQWLTETYAARAAGSRSKVRVLVGGPLARPQRRTGPAVVTTDEIRATLRAPCADARLNHSVNVAKALQMPPRDLPVAPYVLGAWLGDGTSRIGAIASADPQIIDNLREHGETVRRQPASIGRNCGQYTILGLTQRLRGLGVLCNKHIPPEYLRASEAQRRALLAGLLDTDGSIAPNGNVEITLTREALVRDAFELVISLGYKARMSQRPCKGRTVATSTAYRITFTPRDRVFWLDRKAARQAPKSSVITARRFVADVRPVPSVPVRCIAVDSPNHLFLAGDACIPTHNSVFLRPLLATAALSTDPCALWLFDAKLTELAPWAPAAEEMVGRDGKRALKVLKHLQGIADERQREIVATGADKIRRRDGLPVHVIVVDELANFAELDEGKDIMKALRDLASRGRALGISVIAATQVPHSDIIDTTLRNQFSTRVAFRCADRHHAGTILGQSELAAAAAGISDRTPGVGYALGETGRYVRFRSVFVGRPDDDAPGRRDDVLAVVSLASARRVDVELGGQGSGQIPLLRKGERDPHPRPQVDPPAVSKLEETEAMLAEHLNGEPLSRKELARRLGRSPDDATVRRALARMLEDGRAVRTDAGWTRPEPPASD